MSVDVTGHSEERPPSGRSYVKLKLGNFVIPPRSPARDGNNSNSGRRREWVVLLSFHLQNGGDRRCGTDEEGKQVLAG